VRHLPAIDGLRAVAVLAVVAYHAGLPVSAGFVGVDIFFVISGYLITRLLHDEVQATGRLDFMGFYARRARRILPALGTQETKGRGVSGRCRGCPPLPAGLNCAPLRG
jgi:peptidoglycan/LPS O-acetylase OafA/YrhL